MSREQLDRWTRQPPGWLVKCQQRKARNARRATTTKVEVCWSICGVVVLRRGQTARSAAACVLHRASLRDMELGDGRVVPVLAPAGKALR